VIEKKQCPAVDKKVLKASWFSFPFTSIKEEILRGEVCPTIFSAMPWKLHIFFILDSMFYDG